MIDNMNEEIKNWFKRNFYDNLLDIIEHEGELEEDSVIVTFIKKPSTKTRNWLRLSSVNSTDIDKNLFKELILNNYIRNTGEINKYAITGKGVWEIENEYQLIDFIDNKFFTIKDIHYNLDEKEKLVVFSMIAARSFSDISAVNLNEFEKSPDLWKEIIINSSNILKKLKVIPIDYDLFESLKNTGNQHQVTYLFSRLNKLNLKTHGMYQSPGKRIYFIDVVENDKIKISISKLSYLCWLIFKGNIDKSSIELIDDYCRDTSRNMSAYVFNRESHIYNKIEYGEAIKEALIDSLLNKHIWEETS